MKNQESKRMEKAWNDVSHAAKIFALTLVITLFTILFISEVSAIGITPGRRTLDYTAGMEEVIEFRVINTEYKEMDVMLYKDGFLAPFIEFQPQTVHFGADEESKTFRYKIRIDSVDLKGGNYIGSIVAAEVPGANADKKLGATAIPGVATQTVLRVPYPGQYIEAELQIGEAMSPGDKVNFAIVATNLGTEKTKVNAKIDILQGKQTIQKIVANPIEISPRTRNVLRAEWQTFESGVFIARATITYSDKVIVIEKEFQVSGGMIEIKRIFVKNYKLNEIAKVAIVVESKWNEIINDVYSHLIVTSQQGDVVGDFRSSSIDLNPRATETIYAYWDTEGVATGEYDGRIILHYEDQQIERLLSAKLGIDSLQIDIIGLSAHAVETRGTAGSITTILIIIIIVLVLLNLSWFLYFKRLRKPKSANITMTQ